MRNCIVYLIMLSFVMVGQALPAINGVAFALTPEHAMQLVSAANKSENGLHNKNNGLHKNEKSLPCHSQKSSQTIVHQQASPLSSELSHDCCADTVSVAMNQYCEHDDCSDCSSNVSPSFALLTHYLKSDVTKAGNIQTMSIQIPATPYEPAIIPPIA